MLSEVPHIEVPAGKLPGCGVDSRSLPTTPISGLMALFTRRENQSLTAEDTAQLTSMGRHTSASGERLEDGHDDRGQDGQGVPDASGFECDLGFLDLCRITAGRQVADAADG